MTRKGVGAKDFEGGLASMWPDHGKLISHEFPPPGSFSGKHYALRAGEGLPSHISDSRVLRPDGKDLVASGVAEVELVISARSDT